MLIWIMSHSIEFYQRNGFKVGREEFNAISEVQTFDNFTMLRGILLEKTRLF